MKLDFLVVTGLSGAGKSRCMDALEDIGFYCIDNMPPLLISKFVEVLLAKKDKYEKVAIVTDIRGGTNFNKIFDSMEVLKEQKCNCKILFINASDEVLICRFKETRRRHPLYNEKTGDSLSKAIQRERKILLPMQEKADYMIDTSYLSPAQLKQHITKMFLGNEIAGLHISCVSFGFKYGIPSEADLVFDVRCLPNPFYIENLKYQTGLDKPVCDFLIQYNETKKYISKLQNLIDYLIPLYCKEGKSQLMIAFGCTGGKHRSVFFAETMNKHILHEGYVSMSYHRDIKK